MFEPILCFFFFGTVESAKKVTRLNIGYLWWWGMAIFGGGVAKTIFVIGVVKTF